MARMNWKSDHQRRTVERSYGHDHVSKPRYSVDAQWNKLHIARLDREALDRALGGQSLDALFERHGAWDGSAFRFRQGWTVHFYGRGAKAVMAALAELGVTPDDLELNE